MKNLHDIVLESIEELDYVKESLEVLSDKLPNLRSLHIGLCEIVSKLKVACDMTNKEEC